MVPMIKLEFHVVMLLVAAVLALGAARAADRFVGQEVAERWCASCHAIAPGRGGNEQAPAFESIVRERGRSDEWIGTWLSTPHEKMPDLALTRDEIAALVAYFDSLRPAE
jgi:mono/diheme cytochrome c family protein